MSFSEAVPSRPSAPGVSTEQLTVVDRVRVAIGIQRRLAEEWMDSFDTETVLSSKQRDEKAMQWIKKYAVVFRDEFDEYTDEHIENWKRGPGWVWLSQLQARLDRRLREAARRRVN